MNKEEETTSGQEMTLGKKVGKPKVKFEYDRNVMWEKVDKMVEENKATERVKRILKYEPTKMIWSGCILYFRRSTNKQDTTFETQKTACLKKAAELGLPVINEYMDEITGKSDAGDREGMSRMMSEIKAGQVLIVYSISRIARQIDVFYEIIKILKRNGCRIICCHERLDSIDPNMEVIWAVHAAFAQQEREAISSRTKASLQTMIRNGQAVGRPRWGYRIDQETKKLVPDEGIYDIIVDIIKMRTEKRLSLDQIADHLNDIKCPTPSGGGRWERRMVSTVIKKELGAAEAKKFNKEPGLSKKRKENEEELLQEDLDLLAMQNGFTIDTDINKEDEDDDYSNDNNSDIEPEQDEINSQQEMQINEPMKVDDKSNELSTKYGNEIRENLTKKSLIVLRALLTKRREEFGISEEEIRGWEKEDIIELLLN